MTEIRIKKIFFWMLVMSFLATAPVVVFYTMGYRFSFERGIFVYSGSITIKPTPREVNVFIDNEKVSKGVINFLNYSYHMDGFSPGEYSLEVKAPDYYPWFKKVPVHSGISTEFWNIFLVRKKYTVTNYNDGFTDDFFNSPDNKKIALIENNSIENNSKAILKILNIKKEKIEYTFPFAGYVFSSDEDENIEWSPKEGRLSIPLRKDGKRNYMIVNLGTQETFNLNEFLGEQDLRQVRWSSKERNTIFYISQTNLYKVNLRKASEKILVAENIAGYDLSGSDLYYFSKQNKIIYKKSIRGEGDSEQITSRAISAEFGDKFRIIVYDEERITVISQNGDLFLYNDSDEGKGITELGENILGLHFSNDGKKLVFWSKNEIFVYFTRKWETQPIRKQGDLISVARFYQKIENVEWFRDYEHIIFTVGRSIKIVELDRRSLRNIYDVIKIKNEHSKVVYTTKNDNLFFTDNSEKNNDKQELNSISLTEETVK